MMALAEVMTQDLGPDSNLITDHMKSLTLSWNPGCFFCRRFVLNPYIEDEDNVEICLSYAVSS